METVTEMLKNGASIVDVRTPEEFMGGNVAESVNIPLHEVPERINEFKSMNNIVLCCAAGGRSGQAMAFLQQNGIDCINGGAWTDVNYLKNNLN